MKNRPSQRTLRQSRIVWIFFVSLTLSLSSGVQRTEANAQDTLATMKIAFSSNRDDANHDTYGNYEIYVMNGDGTNPLRLTEHPALDGRPSWSPDGTKIAFVSKRDDKFDEEIYVMNADGTQPVRLTHTGGIASIPDLSPDWSPDGSKIAFVRKFRGRQNIFVMNPDGTDIVQLTFSERVNVVPSWSPDSTQIAFSSGVTYIINGDRLGYDQIFVMNADGSNRRQITDNRSSDIGPCWSPDGSKIAFSHNVDGKWNDEIYVMNADGTHPTRLTDHPASDGDPSWSPDGNYIAFVSRRDGNSEIYVMNADGTNLLRLTHHPAVDTSPDWGPFGGVVSVAPKGKLPTQWGNLKESSQ